MQRKAAKSLIISNLIDFNRHWVDNVIILLDWSSHSDATKMHETILTASSGYYVTAVKLLKNCTIVIEGGFKKRKEKN